MRLTGSLVLLGGALLILGGLGLPAISRGVQATNLLAATGCGIVLVGAVLVLVGAKLFISPPKFKDGSPILKLTNRLIGEHSAALLAQRSKSLYRDPYGVEVTKKWHREIEYFYDNFVAPALVSHLPKDVLQREMTAAAALLAERNGLRVGRLRMSHDRALRLVVCQWIDASVRERERARPSDASPFDLETASPNDYELFCVRELQLAGWDAHSQGRSGDQGVDIVARKGRATAVVQCKLYTGSIGNSAVQEVYTGSVFYKAQIAAVVSNAEFTPGARAAARQTGVLLLHHKDLRFLQSDGTVGGRGSPPSAQMRTWGSGPIDSQADRR